MFILVGEIERNKVFSLSDVIGFLSLFDFYWYCVFNIGFCGYI